MFSPRSSLQPYHHHIIVFINSTTCIVKSPPRLTHIVSYFHLLSILFVHHPPLLSVRPVTKPLFVATLPSLALTIPHSLLHHHTLNLYSFHHRISSLTFSLRPLTHCHLTRRPTAQVVHQPCLTAGLIDHRFRLAPIFPTSLSSPPSPLPGTSISLFVLFG